MVSPSAYSWKEWTEGTATEVLYGADLNANFDYVSALVNKGITGGNVATSGIDAAALIANDIIGEAKLDYTLAAGVRVLQIGKNTQTYTGQMVVWGTALIDAENVTNKNITITFANGNACTTGDPGFKVAPYVDAYIVTASPPGIGVVAVATDTAVFNIDLSGTVTFTEAVTLYWRAMGNI